MATYLLSTLDSDMYIHTYIYQQHLFVTLTGTGETGPLPFKTSSSAYL